MSCTLRRCQGKRGCVCPKGVLAAGVYGKPGSPEKEVLPPIVPPKTPLAAATGGGGGGGANAAGPVRGSPAKSAASSSTTGSKKVSLPSPSPSTSAGSQTSENKQLLIPSPKALSAGGSKAQEAATDATTSAAAAGGGGTDPVEEPSVAVGGFSGKVTVRYNHYKKQFNVENGRVLVADIDGEYCLQFAYPNSRLHLSTYSPSDYSYESAGLTAPPLLPEDSSGNFLSVQGDQVYWVHIEEDARARSEYEARQAALAVENAAKRAEQEAREASGLVGVKVEKVESCSCIEGNPCVDKYCCKDWTNRYAVAKANGWKGFQ